MKQIKIYSVKSCPYCDKLKKMLSDNNIQFHDLDLDDVNNKDEVEKLSKSFDMDFVPVIIVDKNVLLPKTSFSSIEQAYSIINKLIK